MKHTKLLQPLAGLLLAGLLAACAGSDGDDAGAGQGATTAPTTSPTTTGPVPTTGPAPPAGEVTVTGTVSEGVEPGCLLLDGYLLVGGDRDQLRPGARVAVTGRVDRDLLSTCQQGVPLVVAGRPSSRPPDPGEVIGSRRARRERPGRGAGRRRRLGRRARICYGGRRMSHHDAPSPALLPVLSRGKHRNPRKGACFMEFASLLAGERWSDHPACTHPLLAAVARHVNDHTSDAGRQRLAGLIPSVIGLTGDDLHIDARIALGSATMALPVVAADRQRVMAVSVLSCDRILAELDGRPADALEAPSRAALAQAPQAAQWASRFAGRARAVTVSAKQFRRQAAPTIVRNAVAGIAQACVPDPDGMLRDLLVQSIDSCAVWGGRDPDLGVLDPAAWATACQQTGG